MSARFLRRGTLIATFLLTFTTRTLADTGTAMGDRGGEGSTAFTGLARAPEANLFTGASGTSINLMLPPGRGNMTPSLTLSYNSAGGRSVYGYGWDLSLARIERSTKYGVPRCTGPTSDLFILTLPGGSTELVNEGGSTYRPVVEDTYIQATKFFSENKWEVVDRSGMKYVFGNVPEAHMIVGADVFMNNVTGCKYTAAWYVTHIEDPNGNTIDFTYTYSALENVPYLHKVEYGANTSSGSPQAHVYQVLLSYDATRPDNNIVTYHAGARMELRNRLATITIKALRPTQEEIREYTFTYDSVGYDDGYESMLKAVGVTGYPEQIFVYAPRLTPFQASFTQAVPLNSLRHRSDSGEVFRTILDMNGDGWVDLVDHQVPNWNVYPGSPTGFAPAAVTWATPAGIGETHIRNTWIATGICDDNGWSCVARDTFDITGDGIPDYIVADDQTTYPPSASVCPGLGLLNHKRWKVFPGYQFTNNGAPGGFAQTPLTWCAPVPFVRKDYTDDGITETWQDVVDMNGDGFRIWSPPNMPAGKYTSTRVRALSLPAPRSRDRSPSSVASTASIPITCSRISTATDSPICCTAS